MPPRKSAPNSKTEIDAITHKVKRANIPTEELRDFVAEDEKAPKVVLYPRDPSLDPQLVWKGKDEQDARPLEVPAPPIYIQEKVHPKVIIEDLRAQAKQDKPPLIGDLFADFNGIKFEDQVDFYRHEQNWSNRMILGDSLLVMTSLAEKEGLKGKVQTIYLDPPYGIKFGSNWQVSTRKRDVKDGKVEDATRQPEQVKAFRDTWELGIHSYLAYLRDRLVAARELLTETGSVFVQIGEENEHLVRCVMDEVLGSDNFVSLITFSKTTGATPVLLPGTADYILWYAKNKDHCKYRKLFTQKAVGGEGGEKYRSVVMPDGTKRPLREEDLSSSSFADSGARVYRLGDITSARQGRPSGPGSAMYFPIAMNGQEYFPPGNRGWTTTRDGMSRILRAARIEVTSNTLAYVRYIDDFSAFPITNVWSDIGGIQSRADPKIYVVQTATTAIERCLLMTTDPGDLVLDPTCGSGSTAHVAEQWGRRWITIDTSRVALALARTRVMAARYPYFLLVDSQEGQLKEAEITAQTPATAKTGGDVRKGFVCKRVPHVTLKSIANNDEIDAIHEKAQPDLDALCKQINKAAKATWEEWEIPRESDDDLPKAQAASLKPLLAKWQQLRRERQQAIDASIARRAEMETLYDQPYEDNKRIRVSGPFTVESLSPHRVLAADENLGGTVTEQEARKFQDFSSMILANLKKAGVQNTIKKERLTFDTLEPFAGRWLHAKGTYTDSGGKLCTVAVCIGPEHGTVGPTLVKEAAKEAVQGVGFDVLVVGGFAFDPHVLEETKRYGSLTVLPAHMNPDLAMGEDLLKKTGAGNLFTVFGEPDIDVKKGKDGKLTVTINGLDIYDPTTGEVRSHSTADIACWFIDTDYNGESFFVRHAYFTGEDKPYDKLKRALKAEIDEAAWSALYRTESRPFARPKSGKIAVKVINHYGDEVLKVYEG